MLQFDIAENREKEEAKMLFFVLRTIVEVFVSTVMAALVTAILA